MRGAIIGLGTIGRGHLRAYAHQDELEIVALVDPLGPRDVVAATGLPRDVPCYQDLDELFSATSLDFIDICSPPHTHLDYIRAAISRDLHVICEKPVLHRDADLDALCDVIDKASTVLFPAHNYRFAPGIVRMRDIVQSASFGELEGLHFRTVRAGNARGVGDWLPNWRLHSAISGGGILRDHGPHSFYVMRFLSDLSVREVSCLAGTCDPGLARPYGEPPVEDTVLARVRFDNGVEGQLEITWAARRRESSYQVRGRAQRVTLTDDEITVTGDATHTERVVSDFNDTSHSLWYRALLAEFAAAARTNSSDVRRGMALRALQEALDVAAAYQSVRNGGEWSAVADAAEYLGRGDTSPRTQPGTVASTPPAVAPSTGTHKGFATCDIWTGRAMRCDARAATRPDIMPNDETGATVYPRYVDRALGAYLWDVDNNRYIDYTLGYGPVILGHNDPRVTEAVVDELSRALSIAPLWSTRQVELTELLTQVIPGAELVYLLKTGSDANSAAVRLARIHTGRDMVLRWGYNGWHDWACGIPAGIPASTRAQTMVFDHSDPQQLREIFERHPGRIACVLTMPFENHTIRPGLLDEIRAITHEHGALFILDEMRSGFRMSLGGAQQYFNVRADLVTLSKAMANGYPISAVAGRADVMSCLGKTRISSTFYASPVEMAAAIRTISLLRDTPALQDIWSLGTMLQDGLRRLVAEFDVDATVVGYPPMPFLEFQPGNERLAQQFYREVIRRGILLHPDHQWFISAAHTAEDVQQTLDACRDAFAIAVRAR